MIYRKILAVSLALMWTVAALAQTGQPDDPPKFVISDDLRVRANGLVKSLGQEADQFYLPENRVKARLLVADLLWESDEKQARQLFQSAVGEMDTLVGQYVVSEFEKDEDYVAFYNIGILRSDLLMRIALRDPEMALGALQTLSRRKADGAPLFEGDEALELQLAEQIVSNDPKQAYEMALKRLNEEFSYPILDTLDALYRRDEELGGKLAREILARIKSRGAPAPAPSGIPANTAANAPDANAGVNVWEIRSFYDRAVQINRKAQKAGRKPLLAAAEIKELLEMLARKYIAQQYLSPYEISGLMTELDRNFPVLAQTLRRKVDGNLLADMVRGDDFQAQIEGRPLEEVIGVIEGSPVANREELYQKAAEASFAAGDILAAKELYSKVKTRPEYDYLGIEIENQLPLALAAKGDLKAVREKLATVKLPEDRVSVLAALAASLASRGETKAARELVEEARALYSGRMKSRKDLGSAMQLSRVLALLEPAQGFSFIEGSMTFVNDIVAAGILIEEFNETGSVRADEVLLSTVEGEAYRNLPNGVALIRSLAAADFDRTLALSERFARREARFFSRFRIAQALLDPKAEEIEVQFSQPYDEEH